MTTSNSNRSAQTASEVTHSTPERLTAYDELLQEQFELASEKARRETTVCAETLETDEQYAKVTENLAAVTHRSAELLDDFEDDDFDAAFDVLLTDDASGH